jgi:hypothetical protein
MFLRNLDGTLALLMGHLLLPTASEAKREGGPTITPTIPAKILVFRTSR